MKKILLVAMMFIASSVCAEKGLLVGERVELKNKANAALLVSSSTYSSITALDKRFELKYINDSTGSKMYHAIASTAPCTDGLPMKAGSGMIEDRYSGVVYFQCAPGQASGEVRYEYVGY